eukprot:TRINITY_DN5804_c0_g1_i1.p1 TRINITY_DN5804_c0_g1~~TRINITY_DN5804_c0_g1_i1.p1  ORF type:complete len:130 (-),score=10.73 TRINITY_DN5804_c0_g1_i1:183-572(-)
MARLFTPAEANQQIPVVRCIVRDIISSSEQIRRMTADQDIASDETMQAIQPFREQMVRAMAQLESMGCSYKDWSFTIGLVDFPAIIDGRQVLLCWRSDEPELKWYHPYETGFAGRQLIPVHLLQEGPTR